MPADSYLQGYYTDLADKLRVGPPLMFVVEDLNMSRDAGDVDGLCSVAGCNDQSFLNQVIIASVLSARQDARQTTAAAVTYISCNKVCIYTLARGFESTKTSYCDAFTKIFYRPSGSSSLHAPHKSP